MQTNYIAFSQEVTSTEKLKLSYKISVFDQKNATLFVENIKDKYKITIYDKLLSLKTLQKQKKIVEEKINNLKKIQEYQKTNIQDKMSFQKIIQNDNLIEQYKIDIENYIEKINQIKEDVFEISGTNINQEIIINDPQYLKRDREIDSHILLKIKQNTLQQSIAKKNLSKENESSNYTITAGYYNRESYDDYINLSVKFPLNIYGIEKNKSAQAKIVVEKVKNELDELKRKLNKDYKVTLIKLNNAKRSIEITNKIINGLEEEIKLLSTQYVSNSLIKIINLENKILDNKLKIETYKLSANRMKLNANYLTSKL
jgi:hypothetical protein